MGAHIFCLIDHQLTINYLITSSNLHDTSSCVESVSDELALISDYGAICREAGPIDIHEA